MTTPPAAVPARNGPPSPAEVIEKALVKGDYSQLSTEQRLDLLRQVCESVGLNPLTRPFDFFTDKKSGKVSLYARKDCTEQLRKIHGVTLEIVGRDIVDDLLICHVRATMPQGKGKRCDEDVGAVGLTGLKGDDRANAVMKAITKAKRRVTLSICGLGFLDESEVVDVAAAEPTPARQQAPAAAGLPAPAPAAQAGQATLEEVARLKEELGLTGEGWKQFLEPWGGRKPSTMPEQERAAVVARLKHLKAARHLEGGLGADGLAVNPGPQFQCTR